MNANDKNLEDLLQYIVCILATSADLSQAVKQELLDKLHIYIGTVGFAPGRPAPKKKTKGGK